MTSNPGISTVKAVPSHGKKQQQMPRYLSGHPGLEDNLRSARISTATTLRVKHQFAGAWSQQTLEKQKSLSSGLSIHTSFTVFLTRDGGWLGGRTGHGDNFCTISRVQRRVTLLPAETAARHPKGVVIAGGGLREGLVG